MEGQIPPFFAEQLNSIEPLLAAIVRSLLGLDETVAKSQTELDTLTTMVARERERLTRIQEMPPHLTAPNATPPVNQQAVANGDPNHQRSLLETHQVTTALTNAIAMNDARHHRVTLRIASETMEAENCKRVLIDLLMHHLPRDIRAALAPAD